MYVGKSCCLSFPFSKKKWNKIKWNLIIHRDWTIFNELISGFCCCLVYYNTFLYTGATDSAISQLPGIVIEWKQPIPFPPPKKMCCWAAETFRASTLLLYKYFFLNRMFYIGNTSVPPPPIMHIYEHTQ